MGPWQRQAAGGVSARDVAKWPRGAQRKATTPRLGSCMVRRLSLRGGLLHGKASVTNSGLEQPELANSEEATPKLGTCKIHHPLPPPGCEASVARQCWGGEVPTLSVEWLVPAPVGPIRRLLLIEDYRP